MKEPIDIITVENDSEARRTAKREIKSKEFVWVKLRGIAEDESDESNHNVWWVLLYIFILIKKTFNMFVYCAS